MVITRSLIFVIGFSAVFISLGLGATLLGSILLKNRTLLETVAGAAIIGLGCFFIASAFVTRLNRDWRPGVLSSRAAAGGPLVAGIAFAFAWTPCIGPTLGAILGLASIESSVGQAAALLAVYSAGLALPFLASALAWGSLQNGLGWVRRHHLGIQVGSGVVMIGMGVLVLTGELFRLNIEIQQAMDRLGLNFFQSV